jgi:type VI protein secretion system component Hcp
VGSNGTPTSTATDVSLEKTVDANSPVLMLDAIRRTQIPTVYLQLRTPLGDATEAITLSNVTVDAYSQIGFNRVRLC